MALREEFERTGNWLFRRRSYLPLFMLVIIVMALRTFRYPENNRQLDRAWELWCFAVSLIGLGARFITVASTPKGTSGRNTKDQRADVLNTTGAYSIVRHPLYLGNFLIWFGLVLSTRKSWFILVAVLAFWLYYERMMFAEEEFLRRKFGNAYLQWAQATPAFFPRFSRWQSPAHRVNWRVALGREYHGLLGIVVSFAALDTMEESLLAGHLEFDPMWVALTLVGLLIYAILRFLKKQTTVLSDR